MESMTRREFLGATAAGAATVLGGCAPLSPALKQDLPFDVVIAGGTVIDGTGAPGRIIDLGVKNGRITALDLLGKAHAARVINASGLTVVPGFIDIHSHVDVDLFVAPKAESKVRQGVTTEVSGMDGDSPAPLGGPEVQRRLGDFREAFGFDCPYRDMDGFFRLLEQKGSAQNLISFIGLGTIREVVVGMDDRPATEDEIKQMQREVLRAIEHGCMGTSTGLEYTPGSFASPAELARVVAVVPEAYRIYATHMRNEADQLLEAMQEAITIARDAGARLQVSHLKAQNKRNWSKGERALRLLDEALASGLDVHADRYPYIAFSTGLSALFPLWVREGGTERFLGRLREPNTRARAREDVEKKVGGLGSWDSVLISSVDQENHKKYQGKTAAQIATEEGTDPFDVVTDLILTENARPGMVGFGMDEPGTELILSWKNTMVASDGAAYSPSRPTSQPHPRSYGTFPRAIAHYQRERKILSLPEMIRRMTSLPASKLGLKDRGVLAVGKAADIVVFDYANVQDRATYIAPHAFPAGIPYVLVNGVPVVDNNVQTEALPGRVLRSS
jgi:N-acyl-D-amino-acid deacylase